MKEQLAEIKRVAEEHLKKALSIDALEELRVKYLGKKGELTAILKGMGALSSEERPKIGALANEVREFLSGEIDKKKAEMDVPLLRHHDLVPSAVVIGCGGDEPCAIRS